MEIEKAVLPLEIIPIRDGGYHCFTQVRVNGLTFRMVVDTGASRTVLDYPTADKLSLSDSLETNEEKASGIGSNDMETSILTLEEFHLGDLIIRDYVAGIIDLRHVNESYKMLEMPNVDGILGCDLLIRHWAQVDFEKKQLVLRQP